MKRTCQECKMKDTPKYCLSYPDLCKNFTYHEHLVLNKQYGLINAQTKRSLYDRFFKAMVGYLDLSYSKNIKDDVVIYYSIDQDVFIKMSGRSKRELGHWLPLNVDPYRLFYFKQKLGYYDFDNAVTQQGRLINRHPIIDDTFLEFKDFIDGIFASFYRQYSEPDIKPKELF